MAKFKDDVFDHLASDIDKIRVRHRQYISYSNEAGAKSVVDEILFNGLDECKNPRSPGNKIHVIMDDRDGFITVTDNGRGIPTDILEKVYTSLNMGSNINTSNKANLKTEVLGQNGTGTLAICGLAERVEITSFRGGTENIYKTLVFEEGHKVHEESATCSEKQHGMRIQYKPSKVMGKNTKIVWKDVKNGLINLQYLLKKKIYISSDYYQSDGTLEQEKYPIKPFEDILLRNEKDKMTSSRIMITIDDDHILEELDGETVRRFLSMDIAFVYTSRLDPYIDSFSNSNNTVDNGDHLDGAIEAICRFFQSATKSMMSEKEKSSLDIKWDDVKTGLSIVVALRTNYERLYTGQTKHKVVSGEIRKIIISLTMGMLNDYFSKNQNQLKELCLIVKMNAKVRREGEKVRTAVVKNTLTNWSSYKMKNYDPCTNRGLKEYKELYIIEGDSAKGSLKVSRNPAFQALFAIRGVSGNVYKMSIDQIVGPKGNKEFTDLVTIMGCNIGPKFDINKLQFNKIIIASDADVDGLFIRSLLLSFFFKMFPELILDGRIYVAEPPLYRVDDSKNPFVINKEDYVNRYVKLASKSYKIGRKQSSGVVDWFTKDQMKKFLFDTNAYIDDLELLVEHYEVNGRLLEIIMEEFSDMYINYEEVIAATRETKKSAIVDILNLLDIQHLMDRIGEEFPEIYYDDKDQLIKGAIDGTYQLLEISNIFVDKSLPLIYLHAIWTSSETAKLVIRNIKMGEEYELSLLGVLKILRKYQPKILHRFKGLGENNDDDIKKTIMDPNTRTLIKVEIGNLENDMKIFQMLRGGSNFDLQNRKLMMREYKIPRDMIDT